MTDTAARVEVTTTIRAPRERVFDAWLDPVRLARFLCAGGTHVSRVEVDARCGGAETTVTVTFESIDEGTRVTLVHVGLPDEAAAKRHHGGWQSILDKCRDAAS